MRTRLHFPTFSNNISPLASQTGTFSRLSKAVFFSLIINTFGHSEFPSGHISVLVAHFTSDRLQPEACEYGQWNDRNFCGNASFIDKSIIKNIF
nr:MAG TPA: hypothetical protein [Caudoviricetes sp.]